MEMTETTNTNAMPAPDSPAMWIGLDWGDQQHSFALADSSGAYEEGILDHSAENLHQWLKSLGQRTGGRAVRLGIETSRGAVIHALLQYPWLQIYPINPITSARYRGAFRPSGAKDDLPDARVLLELVRQQAHKLRPLQEQEPQTVKLSGLVEARRGIVDQRTGVINRLTSLLKSYYPQALELFDELNSDLAIALLRRWPELISLKEVRPAVLKRFYYLHQVRSEKLIEKRLERIAQAVALTTEDTRVSVAILQLHQLLDELKVLRKHVARFDAEIKTVFAAHPEASLFRDLPGAGAQMAPRLCVAFGTIRSVYPEPASLQKYAGVAPVREKSGNQLWTHWRWRAPAFLRQTFVEWAGLTVRYSEWARVYYQNMRKKNKQHAIIIRALAFKWIRILWKCWQQRVPYDEARYLKQLARRKSPHAIAC